MTQCQKNQPKVHQGITLKTKPNKKIVKEIKNKYRLPTKLKHMKFVLEINSLSAKALPKMEHNQTQAITITSKYFIPFCLISGIIHPR